MPKYPTICQSILHLCRFKVMRIKRMDRDLFLYTFALPRDQTLGTGIGQHAVLGYTRLDFVVKVGHLMSSLSIMFMYRDLIFPPDSSLIKTGTYKFIQNYGSYCSLCSSLLLDLRCCSSISISLPALNPFVLADTTSRRRLGLGRNVEEEKKKNSLKDAISICGL